MQTKPIKLSIMWILVLVSIGLYYASLNLEVFSCPASEGFTGYQTLKLGWLGFAYLDPRWIANIFYLWMILGLIFPKIIKVFQWVKYLTICLAIAAIPFPSLGCPFIGGAPAISDHLATGGYLWVTSVCLVSLVSIWSCVSESSQKLPA